MIKKNLIKKNSLLTIIADYFISFMGFNFEKEYKLVNSLKKKFPIIVATGMVANRKITKLSFISNFFDIIIRN